MKVLVRSLLIIAIIFVALAILLLLHFAYDDILECFARYAEIVDKTDLLKKLIPLSIIRYIITMLSLVLCMLLFLLLKFQYLYPGIVKFASETRRSIVCRFRNDWTGPLVYLLIIPVSASIYYTFRMPVSIDEAYMYKYFSSRSFFSSIFYYPAPNNHILHSLLTNIFLIFPFPDLICIRIPSVLASILCLLFLFSLTREYYNKYIAYTAIAIFSGLSMTVYYSFMSRGYALQCLFFILMTYSIQKVLGQPRNKSYWHYFCLSGILGLYTMPSFLYPLLIGNLFLVIKLRGITAYHVLSILCIGAFTSILYMPILLVNDIHHLANSFPLAPISRALVIKRMIPFLYQTYINITGLPFILTISSLCAGLAISILMRRELISRFLLMVLIISPVLLIIQSVIPYSRTFQYYNVIFSVFSAILLFQTFEKYAVAAYFFAGLIVVQGLLLFNSNRQIKGQERYSIVTQEILPRVASGRAFLIYSPGFDLYLDFYFRERNISGYSCAGRTDDLARVDMDTVAAGRYDYCIVENYADETEYRKPAMQTDYYRIYK